MSQAQACHLCCACIILKCQSFFKDLSCTFTFQTVSLKFSVLDCIMSVVTIVDMQSFTFNLDDALPYWHQWTTEESELISHMWGGSQQKKQLSDLQQEEWSLSELDTLMKSCLTSHWLWWPCLWPLCELAHRAVSVLSCTYFLWRITMSSSTMMSCDSMSSQIVQYFFSSSWSNVWKCCFDVFWPLRSDQVAVTCVESVKSSHIDLLIFKFKDVQ